MIILVFAALLNCIIAAPSQNILATGTCRDGSNPVQCFVNPCQFTTCPAVEGATCIADYCGGCNDRWIRSSVDVTHICKGSCRDGSNPVVCVVNPCQFATCPGVKGAKCVADYCGGCFDRWVLGGEDVTHLCDVDLWPVAAQVELECSIPGQVYTDCGSACPPTCNDPDPICIDRCVEGCQCPRGTVLHDSRCILPKSCPVQTPVERCLIPGQVYTDCGTACPPTCNDPDPICIDRCIEGCQCPRGTVLHENHCISPKSCPVQTPVERCLIPGQVYTDCGTACPPTCDDPNPICIDRCVEGCQCPRGTVLDGMRCIPQEKCLSL